MPDITMCASATCKDAKDCYRKNAKPSELQSYADFSQGKKIMTCEHFIQMFRRTNG